jgi:hypothetical protein
MPRQWWKPEPGIVLQGTIVVTVALSPVVRRSLLFDEMAACQRFEEAVRKGDVAAGYAQLLACMGE